MENNELVHHGVEGQKWGKRNGPPYPLSKSGTKRSGSHAKKEKAGKKQKKQKKSLSERFEEYLAKKAETAIEKYTSTGKEKFTSGLSTIKVTDLRELYYDDDDDDDYRWNIRIH